ncbi:MAG TPA: SH3 domain-containing protein [Bdellovibrionota bacterium]|nr:SH3 domain-containing protein [Bdellovibrionota bacterium]
MKRFRFWFCLLLGVLASLEFSCSAWAARETVIENPDAELRQGPGKKFSRLAKLPAGTWVTASNYPIDGYYKIRTLKGQVGWVSADAFGTVYRATIETDSVLVRNGTNTKAKVLFTLEKGAAINAMGTPVNGWVAIRNGSEQAGWIPATAVFVDFSAVVIAGNVEVRQGPTAATPAIATLARGTWVTSSKGLKNGFYKVRTPDGRLGWVPSKAIDFRQAPEIIEPVQAAGDNPPTEEAPPTEDW